MAVSCRGSARQEKARMFFFEKKNQKTFASLRTLVGLSATANKSFLLLFFKKEVLSC
jgi:hypothetical protein